MPSQKPILVLGATGRQGGAAAKYLLSAGWSVRALSRKPDAEPARALRNNGVEVIAGSMDDPADLDKAMDGVYGVFSVQNFWECGYEREIRQGKNVADAAKRAGISHLVYSSVGGAERKTGLPHFESKWQIEEYIRSIGVQHTIIRPVSFMENFLRMKDAIANGLFPSAGQPDKPQQFVAVDDIGAAAAKAFAEPERFAAEAFELASDELTPRQVAETFSKVLGKPVRHVQTPMEEVRKQMGEEGVKMIEWIDREGYKADLALLRSRYGLQLTRLEEWIRRTGWV